MHLLTQYYLKEHKTQHKFPEIIEKMKENKEQQNGANESICCRGVGSLWAS